MEESLNQNIPSPAEPVVATPTPLPNQPPFGSWWKMGMLIVGFLLAGSIAYTGYQYSQKQTVPLSKPNSTPAVVTTPTPDPTINWSVKTSTACNVVFSVPPKEAPYYTPDNPGTSPDLAEDGAFWQFQEYNNENNLFKYSNSLLFSNPKAGGSGYIPGLVSVSCSANDKNYNLESLLNKYRLTLEDASAEIKISKVETLDMFGRKVYAVYIKGGMYDETRPDYIFATDKHIYLVGKVVMSSNSIVKETTEIIFKHLKFND